MSVQVSSSAALCDGNSVNTVSSSTQHQQFDSKFAHSIDTVTTQPQPSIQPQISTRSNESNLQTQSNTTEKQSNIDDYKSNNSTTTIQSISNNNASTVTTSSAADSSSCTSTLPPIVLISGFMGCDFGTSLYWHCALQQAQSINRRVIVCHTHPLSSLHDRARDVFYRIKGGRVDLGARHSLQHGHERFGETHSNPLYPEWDENHPLHFVGHVSCHLLSANLSQFKAYVNSKHESF
jgi:hypothetical protein